MDTKDERATERHTLKTVATSLNMWFLFSMSMLSAIVFIAGLVGVRGSGVEIEDSILDEWLWFGIGIMGFSLFFPWFSALYFA